MSTIQVKPNPDLDPAAWPLIVHPASGGLLDAAKKVPDDGRPWLYDGFTCRMLTDGAILRADDPVFATRDAAEKEEAESKAAKVAADAPTKVDAAATAKTTIRLPPSDAAATQPAAEVNPAR